MSEMEKQPIEELTKKQASGINSTDTLLVVENRSGQVSEGAYQVEVNEFKEYVAGDAKRFLPPTHGTAGQLLRSTGDGGSEWGDAASPEEIAEAVTDWLDENVPTGETLVVDESLTIEGAAADAKVTGEKITSAEDAITDLRKEMFSAPIEYTGITVSGSWVTGSGVNAQTGGNITDDDYCRTNFIPINSTTYIHLDSETYDFNVWEYTSNNVGSAIFAPKGAYNDKDAFVTFDQNATYFRIGVRRKDLAHIQASDITALTSAIKTYATTDPTLSISGAAADAKATGDAISELKSAFNKSAYDKTPNYDIIEGEYVRSSTGVIESGSSFARTDYIDIENAASVTLAWETSEHGPALNALCFFDSNKAFLSGITDPLTRDNESNTYPIPEGAFYIIFSGYKQSMPKSIVLFKLNNITSPIGEIWNEFENKASIITDFYGSHIDGEISLSNVYGVTKFPSNLVNPIECIDNNYIDYRTGNEISDNAYFCTGFINVEPGETYRSNIGRNYAWYDSQKVYLSGNKGTDIQSGITAINDAKYIRFTINKTLDGTINPLDVYFTKSSKYTDGVHIPGFNINQWCYNKKINWIGDSIVDGPDFDEIVCDTLGMIKSTEYGINGSTIALKADGTDGRHALCERYVDMSDDADIIAVSCGTNDFEYAWCPIGTINDLDDGSSNNTFYGALKTLCKGLIDKYPQKVIFFTTPIKRAQAFEDGNGGEYTADGAMTTPFSKNKYGKTLGDYADIIKEVCGYYSIPVLDMYRESLLNPHLTAQQNMFDSVYTHPNTIGQKIMARRVAGWLTQLGYTIPNLT